MQHRTASPSPASFLKISGYSSLFLGLFHIPFLFLGEGAARFFSAPAFVRLLVREQSPWLYLVVAVLLAVFGFFALVPLSAAGAIRWRVPLQRGLLTAIATVYTLRGLILFPQLLACIGKPGSVPLQVPVFSGVALAVAAFYWLGVRELLESGRARTAPVA